MSEKASERPDISRQRPTRRQSSRQVPRPKRRPRQQPALPDRTSVSAAPVPGPRPRRRKKQRRKAPTSSLIPKLIGLVFIGMVGGMIWLGVSFANGKWDAEPPVLAVGPSHVAVDLEITATLPNVPQNVLLTSNYDYEINQTSADRVVTVRSFSTEVRKGLLSLPTTLECNQHSATLSTGLGKGQEFTPTTAPPNVRELMKCLGEPLYRVPVSSEAIGPPEIILQGSQQTGRDAGNIQMLTAFVHAPFATNVESWRLSPTWAFQESADVSGDLLFLRESNVGDEVPVQVEGVLKRLTNLHLGGVTLARLTATVTGSLTYSTRLNQWKSGELDLSVSARDPKSSAQITIPVKLSFTTASID